MAGREFTNINGIKVCDQTARDSIPTKTSQLTNDSDYATITQVNQAIDNAQLGGSGQEVDLSIYQTKTDNTLNTTDKTVVGAINEINETMVIAEEQTGDITVGEVPVGGSNNAKDISIADTGNYFTSTNVEGALQEAGSQIIKKASQSDLEVERARIDSFTSLNEGSTTGDAELIDGRIGADGITYASIGSSIRGQFNNIIEKSSSNLLILLDKAETTSGTGITYSIKNNVININGTASRYTELNIPFNFNYMIGKSYTVMCQLIYGSNDASGLAQIIKLTKDSNAYVQLNVPNNSIKYAKGVLDGSINNILLCFQDGSVLNDCQIKIWIAEGEISYENPKNVKLKKNVIVNDDNMPQDYIDIKNKVNDISNIIIDKYDPVNLVFTKDKYIDTSGVLNSFSNFYVGSISVLKGDKFILNASSTGIIMPYIIFDENNDLVECKNQDFTSEIVKYTDLEINIPKSGTMYVNGYVDMPILTKKNGIEIKQTNNDAKNVQLIKKSYETFAINEQLKNDFSWKTPNKLYVTFVFDDSNSDIGEIQELFASKNVPCCFATIPKKLYNTCDNGKTVKEVLQECENNNGEVLAHWHSPLTQNSTNEDYENVYIGAKQTLIGEGFNVQGIITSGGTNYNTQDFSKCVKLARPYYRYGDLTSYDNPKIEQYYNMRYFLSTNNDDNKAKIDKFITNGQLFYNDSPGAPYGKPHWLPIGSHGQNDNITIAMLEELLDYIISKGSDTIEIINYRDLFDLATSSKLEKRLLILENN